MPKLTFPVSPDGLPVDVLVGLDVRRAASLQAAGHPLPPAVQIRGLLDTASDATIVDSAILRRIGAVMHSQTSTQTAGGSIPVNVFEAWVNIMDASNPGGPMLMHPLLLVMELQHPLPNANALIGLDILLGCKLFLDGPGLQFSLEW
jgi:hypothetical protein